MVQMTKNIDTLATDINQLFKDTLEGRGKTLEEAVLAKFGASVAMHVVKSLEERKGERKPNTLYVSEVCNPCSRRTWYAINKPHLGEKLLPHTLFKFLYGDLIEEVVLLLAESAGHRVEDKQKRIELVVNNDHGSFKIVGRQDAVIDGVLVDVKSCSSYAYKKFKEGLTEENDSFGYKTQLSTYNGRFMPTHLRQGFLAVDKQNGHVGFFEDTHKPTAPRLSDVVADVSRTTPPKRTYELVPEGKSGNMKLGVECSYCPYKQECWKDANGGAGLKAYAYSYGPVFLAETKRIPAVPEIPLGGACD